MRAGRTAVSNGVMSALGLAAVLMLFAPAADAAKLIVPAYWGSWGANECSTAEVRGAWVSLEAGKSNVIAVINPNSGPDFTGGDATVKCLPHLKRAGNTLIGYVATGYGKRSLSDISRDIQRYRAAYAPYVTGIFFDEGISWWQGSAAMTVRYNTIAKMARAAGFTYLVINGGTRFPSQFLAAFDLVIGYESTAADWRNGNNHGVCPPPKFASRGDDGYCKGTRTCDLRGFNCRQAKKGQVAALVYCQSSATFEATMAQAMQAGYGAVYLTNAGCGGANPWDRLASYWSSARKALG